MVSVPLSFSGVVCVGEADVELQPASSASQKKRKRCPLCIAYVSRKVCREDNRDRQRETVCRYTRDPEPVGIVGAVGTMNKSEHQ